MVANVCRLACLARRPNTSTASRVPQQDLTNPPEGAKQAPGIHTGREARDLASAGNTISPLPYNHDGEYTSAPAMAPERLLPVIARELISSQLAQEEDTTFRYSVLFMFKLCRAETFDRNCFPTCLYSFHRF